MRNYINKISFFLFAMLFAMQIFAGIEPVAYSIIPRGTGIGPANLANITVQDNNMTSTGIVKKSFAKVSLKIIETSTFLADYNYTMRIRVKSYNKNNILISNQIQNLTIIYKNGHLTPQTDISSLVVNGVHRVVVDVLNPNASNAINQTNFNLIPVNVSLNIEIITERYYPFNPLLPITNYGFNPIRNTYANPNGTGTQTITEEIEAYWDYFPGAEEYDLEWTFVDNYSDGNLINTLSPSQIDVDFRNNSTRVILTENSYRIPLINERGYLIFRVRPIGRDVANNNLSAIIEGKWSVPFNPIVGNEDGGVLSVNFGNIPALPLTANNYNLYCIYPISSVEAHMHENMNWQYNSTFAENGKRKIVMNYADGSLRSRQLVTKNNSDNTTIVGESIYDYQGRKAVDVLPVPDPNDLNALTYHPYFNLNAANKPYSKDDFDKSATNCNVAPAIMSTVSGASKYYSSENVNADGANKYIPDAFGYPFVQTEYMPDNTGRVRAQGGVGDNHYLGTNHETKYEYGTPDQEELDRMFGTDVGYYQFYKKNMVTDANGQISISYLDMENKTIATALAGTPPGAVNALTSSATTNTISATYIDATSASDNGNNIVDNSLVFTKNVLIESNTNYTIDYEVTPTQFNEFECYRTIFELPNTICFDCVYDLNISLKDKCGNEVLINNPTNYQGYSYPNTEGFNSLVGHVKWHHSGGTGAFVFTGFADMDDCVDYSGNPYAAPIAMVNLQPGAYTLTKTLTVNKDAMDNYVNQLIASSCLKSEEAFVYESREILTESNGCNVPCLDCMEPVSSCETNYKMMLNDVSPGGQYAQYTDNGASIDPSSYKLSVLNEENGLPMNNLPGFTSTSPYDPDWRHPIFNGAPSHYRNTDGSFAYVPIVITDSYYAALYSSPTNYGRVVKATLLNGVLQPCTSCTEDFIYASMPEALKTVSDFKNNWRMSYARELVEYHPEFAYYQFCITTTASSLHYYPQLYTATTNPSATLSDSRTDFYDNWKSHSNFVVYTEPTLADPNPTLTTKQISSQEFDENLVRIRNVGGSLGDFQQFFNTVANGYSDPDDYLDPNVLPSAGLSTTSDLLDLDPLFKIDGNNNKFNKYSVFGSNTEEIIKTFRAKFLSKLASSPNTNFKKALTFVTNDPATSCQNIYYSTISPICADAPANASATLLSVEQFYHYIDFYITTKQQILVEMADEFAMVTPYLSGTTPHTNMYDGTNYVSQLNGTNVGSYNPENITNYRLIKGYNSCIGNPTFDPGANGFQRHGSITGITGNTIYTYPAWISQYLDFYSLGGLFTYTPSKGFGDYDTDQTCNYSTYSWYQTKAKRFQSSVSYATAQVGVNPNNVTAYTNAALKINERDYYQQTGKCAITQDFVGLLNKLIDVGILTTTGSASNPNALWLYPEFTQRMYDAIVPLVDRIPFNFFIYHPTVSTASTLDAELIANENQMLIGTVYPNTNGFLHLDLTGSNLTSLSQVSQILEMSAITQGNPNQFTLKVLSNIPNDNTIYYINGTTSLDLFGCTATEAPLVCHPKQIATDLKNLMNGLLSADTNPSTNNDFYSTSNVQLTSTTIVNTPYDALLTSIILSSLGNGANSCVWNWVSLGGNVYEIFSTNSTCSNKSLRIELGSSMPSNGFITSISYNSSVTPSNFLEVEVQNSTGSNSYYSIPFVVKTVVGGTVFTELSLYDCATPTPSVCEGIEFSNGNDFPLLLQEIGLPTTSLTNINHLPHLTESIKAQFGDVNATYGVYNVNFDETQQDYTYSIGKIYNCENGDLRIIEGTNGICFEAVCDITIDLPDEGNLTASNINVGTFPFSGAALDMVNAVNGVTYSLSGLTGTIIIPGSLGTADIDIELPYFIKTCLPMKECNACPVIVPQVTQQIISEACSTAYNSFVFSPFYFGSVYSLAVNANDYFHLDLHKFWANKLYLKSEKYIEVISVLQEKLSYLNDLYLTSDPYPSNILADPSSNYFISLNDFNRADVCGEYEYLNYLDGIINSTFVLDPSSGLVSPSLLSFNEFTSQYCPIGCTNTEIPITQLPTEAFDPSAECISHLEGVAHANAQSQYEQYLQDQIEAFKNAYIAKCLTAVEGFKVNYESNKYHYTLYYYDQAGNLYKTVPPKGVALLPNVPASYTSVKNARNTNTGISVPTHSMATVYSYNSLNQLKSQKIPDHDHLESNFYYDKLGRMVASQNPKQFADSPKRYSYTKYDALGRITEVAELSANATIGGVGGTLLPNNIINDIAFNNWINGGSKRQITKTIYDYATLPSFNFQTDLMRGRVAATKIDADGDAVSEKVNHYSYDVHGNVKSMIVQDNEVILSNIGNKRIDYTYDLISGKVNIVSYQKGQKDQFHHQYQYDADNRITEVYTSKDTYHWDRDAKYFYYLHGPLARVEIGQKKVQATDYYYTIQGWIKGVNGEVLNPVNDPGKDGYKYVAPEIPNGYLSANLNIHANIGIDAYAYSLGYFEKTDITVDGTTTTRNKDYVPIKNGGASIYQTNDPYADLSVLGASLSNMPNLYNGNIKHMGTTIVDVVSTPDYLQHGMPLLQGYKYDQLNRLANVATFHSYGVKPNTSSLYAINDDQAIGTYNKWTGAFLEPNASTFTYDANGNIELLNRKGYLLSGTSYTNTIFDQFDYDYPNANNNKLDHVDDVSLGTILIDDIDDQNAGNYTYDNIGNLTSDASEQISNIEWNVYGKIEKITRSETSTRSDLEFKYNSNGERIMKIEKSKTNGGGQLNWIYTHYERDAQGNVMAVYETTFSTTTTSGTYVKKVRLRELDIYGSSRLGVLNMVEKEIFSSTLFTANVVGGLFTNVQVVPTATSPLILEDENLPGLTLNGIVTHREGNKSYEMSNHLGNVMAVVSDKKRSIASDNPLLIDHYIADVISATDYYPFGAPMPGRQFNSTDYRYGFNGKENDDETGTQDYGMRIYNPSLGKFLSVDPLAREFAWNSPYSFAENDVIRSIDLDGAEKYIQISVYSHIKDDKPVIKTVAWSELHPGQEHGPAGPVGTMKFDVYKSFKKLYYRGFEATNGDIAKEAFTKAAGQIMKFLNLTLEGNGSEQRGGYSIYAETLGGADPDKGTKTKATKDKNVLLVNIDAVLAYALGGGGSEAPTIGTGKGAKSAEGASNGTSGVSEVISLDTEIETAKKKDSVEITVNKPNSFEVEGTYKVKKGEEVQAVFDKSKRGKEVKK